MKRKKTKDTGFVPEKLKGAEGFETYYHTLFGERWPVLQNALLEKNPYAEWNAGGQESYFLDTGSVLAALMLPLAGAKKILDLCAAPGGKTLILASRMDTDAELTANERSPARKQRLVHVCDQSLDRSTRGRVAVVCSDGARWCCTHGEVFDRILLDVPCSSERHVLSDSKYLRQWSPSRIKSLTLQQWALVSSAFRMLVPGGYLLYSTCALNPLENDGIMERVFKKFDTAESGFSRDFKLPAVIPDSLQSFCSGILPGAEKKKFGYHVVPDVQGGAGPLYFSLIRKKMVNIP